MKTREVTIALAFAMQSGTATGQPASSPIRSPVALAALLEQEGTIVAARRVVLVRVGEPPGEVELRAVRAWPPGFEAKPLTGLEFTISDRQVRRTAILDVDEVGGLVKAIEEIKLMITSVKAPQTGTTLIEESSITYRSRGTLRVHAFGSPGGFLVTVSIVDLPAASVTFHSSRLDELSKAVAVGQVWLAHK